jgi:hypothetical protein
LMLLGFIAFLPWAYTKMNFPSFFFHFCLFAMYCVYFT